MKTLKYKDKDGEYQKLYDVYTPEADPFNGYEYVDMGDAGIWCVHNVGADNAVDDGLYFAWGETEGYENGRGDKKFSWKDYKFGTENNITKYNDSDNLTTLELEDDAAHVIMGGGWRIPTNEEFQKLIDLCYRNYITTYNGEWAYGILFTLNSDNSKQLFFPLSCFYMNGSLIEDEPVGRYWTSSLSNKAIWGKHTLIQDKGYASSNNSSNRYLGCSLRAIYDPNLTK